MIPKIIHYCWFGHGGMPKLALECIDSWKKHMPDYEIVLWDEKKFDININQYVKEAYEAKKYAFVTDYVRLYALYHHGGVYMDTDVEVLKSLNIFLQHKAFTGCESDRYCVTGTMAAERNHPWIKKLLDEYNNIKFILNNGEQDITTNTFRITRLTIDKYDWVPENKYQTLKDDLHIYTSDTFCAKDWRTGKITKTDQTYTIHHFSGHWITTKSKKRLRINMMKTNIKNILGAVIGENNLEKLLQIRRSVLR